MTPTEHSAQTDADAPEPRAPLRLADSSEGSTLPVPGGASSSADSAAASSTEGMGKAGGTTGGFETMLGKLVMESGLATREEVELCNTLLDESNAGGTPQTLSDVLVGRDFVTRHQLARLQQDFEAKRSGSHIPGYKLLKKLGSGAMATVFLARQISLDRHVAIKILPKKFSGNEKFIERFYKEGRAAAKLNHPNIVGAYDVGRAGEHHYFVMEYVDGETIHDVVRKQKRMKEKDALTAVRQVALALKHAHERGFVHRDIKPKNVMLTRNGTVKLADLGLARAISDDEAAKAEAGRAYGTPYYISPEQIRGEIDIGPSADIYGLGATLYHMVTGRVPFEGKNPSQVMHKHLKSALEPPDHLNPEISAGCAQIIEMMMAKKVKNRYQNADDLLEDIDLVLSGETPHFAHRTLDHAAITDALTDVVEAPSQIPMHTPAPKVQAGGQSPLFMTILVIAALSVIANLVLLAVVLS